MVKISHSVTIQRPAPALFAELTDFDHSYRWQTSAVLKEWHEPEGPVALGTKGYQQRIFRGKPIETMNTVSCFEPGHRMIAESPDSRVEYLVTPLSEDEARLDFSIELYLKGAANLFAPLIRRGLRQDVQARFDNLKRYLETGEAVRNSW